jgi:SAM-dependent methyltransferase
MDARAATGFAGAARAYDLGRPSWPPEALAPVAEDLGLPRPGASALDLAAGTGKLTVLLPGLAERVLAVEPAEAMLEVLREHLPDADARVGRAEAIPFEDASADLVTVAEAFHWFDVPEAVAEIARVLRPGGGLALLWHRGAWTATGDPTLFDRYQAIVGPLRDAAGAFPSIGTWREGIEGSGRFTAPLREHVVEHDQALDPEQFVALAASMSWIVNLPDDRRQEALDDVRALVDGQDSVVLRHRAEVQWTRLR